MFYCGTAAECITPKMGMSIPGYFDDRLANGIKDELFAKAVAMRKDDTTVVFVACDAINLDPEDVDEIRAQVGEKYPDAKVIVNATHTHTGGPTWEGFRVLRNSEYLKDLTASAAKAAVCAIENLKPAKFGSATGAVEGVAFIRRFYRPDGTVVTNPAPSDMDVIGTEGVPDNTFTLFKITDLSGKLIALMTSYGVHLDTVGDCEISADYPGQIAKLVAEKYGAEVMSFFSTGPCGNTNHYDRNDVTTYDKWAITKRMAKTLFAEIERLEPAVEMHEDVALSYAESRFSVPLRKPTEEQLSYARGILSGEIEEIGAKMRAPVLFSECVVKVSEYPAKFAMLEVSRVHIGNATFISWPGEIFCDFGMEIRRENRGRDIIISELNGTCGAYIPTKAAFARGGYEPDLVDPISLPDYGGDMIVAETRKIL